jgi:hypothetical protein
LKPKDSDIDSLELEFLARGHGDPDRSDRYGSSSLTPMLLDLDEDTPTRDELASRFFAKPEGAAPAPLPVEDAAREVARFQSPAFKARQRYLMRYVAGAVAFSGAICLAAFFRVAAASPDTSPHAAHASQAVAAHDSLAPAELPATPSQPAVAAAPLPPPPPAPIAQEAPPAAPVIAAPTAASPAPQAVASDGPAARESKDVAMHALEHGNWNGAIAAAERSVRLDPTDGEAWLILGGAYQERGSDRAAHRAFVSCSQNAKPGHARSECASLARSP